MKTRLRHVWKAAIFGAAAPTIMLFLINSAGPIDQASAKGHPGKIVLWAVGCLLRFPADQVSDWILNSLRFPFALLLLGSRIFTGSGYFWLAMNINWATPELELQSMTGIDVSSFILDPLIGAIAFGTCAAFWQFVAKPLKPMIMKGTAGD